MGKGVSKWSSNSHETNEKIVNCVKSPINLSENNYAFSLYWVRENKNKNKLVKQCQCIRWGIMVLKCTATGSAASTVSSETITLRYRTK